MPVALIPVFKWLGVFALGNLTNEVASFFGDLYEQMFGSPTGPKTVLGGTVLVPFLIGLLIVGLIIWIIAPNTLKRNLK